MAELMKFTNGYWDLSFFRGVPDWELEAVTSFMDTINSSFVRGFREDKMSWTQDRNKGFLVNDFYNLLVGSNDFCFLWKRIYKQKIPSWVAFFVWIVALGKCLIIDNFRKRKVCKGASLDKEPTKASRSNEQLYKSEKAILNGRSPHQLSCQI